MRNLRAVSGSSNEQLTELLRAWSGGSPQAAERLLPLVYDQLRGLAARQLRAERSDHTLRPTALVHEVFLRLADQHEGALQNRVQFFALAAQAMRRILLDYARARHAAKRAGSRERISLNEQPASEGGRDLDVIALNTALEELQAIDPEKVRLVELRFFAGLSVEEVAEVLGVSPSTVAREWRLAKAWLYRRLEDPDTA